MRLLLDTHIALWAISDDPRLPQKARDLIFDPASAITVSAASIWEISIKHSLGRGDSIILV
jgi:PIN domain nuclease of toxin-antitoxin system